MPAKASSGVLYTFASPIPSLAAEVGDWELGKLSGLGELSSEVKSQLQTAFGNNCHSTGGSWPQLHGAEGVFILD